MFTNRRFESTSVFSGDWQVDGPKLLRILREYQDSLETKGALNISEAQILASQGIVFPATAVSSTNANTLDDYREVSCTPTLFGASVAGTQTYAASTQGSVTKIGRVVFLHDWRVTLTAKGGTMAGAVRIGGLPYTSAASTGAALTGSISISAFDNINLSAGYSYLGLLVPSADTVLHLYESGDNVAAQQVDAAAIANTSSITLSGFYRA